MNKSRTIDNLEENIREGIAAINADTLRVFASLEHRV
jgi:hypothetical protein